MGMTTEKATLTVEEKDIDRIADVIANKMAQKMTGMCVGACGLSQEARKEMGHIIGVLKDQGNDSYSQGAEKLRQALKLFASIDKASTWVARALIVTIALVILKLIGGWAGSGAIDWLKKALGP